MRLVLVALLAVSVSGYQLEVSPNNSCIVRGNGTCINFSKMFDFPVSLDGPGFNPSVYAYQWDPCKGVLCNDRVSAICQLVRVERGVHVGGCC